MSRALGALRDRAPRAVGSLDLPEACEIPQLAAIVEPGRLTRALGDALAQADPGAPPLLRCSVLKVHYRPGRECRLVISARFRSGRLGEEQLYFGKLLADKPLAGARGRVANGSHVSGGALPRFGPAATNETTSTSSPTAAKARSTASPYPVVTITG